MLFRLICWSVVRRCFLAVLILIILGLAGTALPALGEELSAASPVTGLRVAGPDLEVFLSASSVEKGAAALLVDAAGVRVAAAPIAVRNGIARARLADALAAVPRLGMSYRVILVSAKGETSGLPFPFLVSLRCAPGAPCRFQLLPGLTAPGAALIDPALSHALDTLPAGTVDLLAAAAAADPTLRGAALTAAWSWASLAKIPPGTCGCFWTLEAALPSGTLDGGVGLGLVGQDVQNEEGMRAEQSRSSSLVLRQRCVSAEIRPATAVTVADGDWSASLKIPRVVLTQCPEACSPATSWQTEVEGRALAQAEGASDATAAVEWQAELTVDGASALQLDDEISSTPGGEGGESVRRARWSGAGAGVGVRASAHIEAAAPGGPSDVDAVAAVAWRLVGQGASSCAQPRRVDVSSTARSMHHQVGVRPLETCDPGQIGLLTGGECP